MPDSDVTAGPAFAVTRWSRVLAAGREAGQARACLDWLCRAYWEPLHAHARRRGWRDADDAVQDFWVRLIERGSLASADPARGRFRTWLLACLDHHLADRHAAASAAKRGGGQAPVPLDEDAVGAGDEPDRAFDRAWARTLLARARDRLIVESGAGQARAQRLEPFLTANGDAAAYAAAGADLGLTPGAVKVAVHRLRQRFRDCLRAEVAETLADPTAADVDRELGDLLAALDA